MTQKQKANARLIRKLLKGSNVRFVGFGKREPLVLTAEQKLKLEQFFGHRLDQSKPASKRKAA